MATFLCCKCFNEFDDTEGTCPVCDFPVCRGDCNECNKKGSEKRYLMAQIICEETPFIGSENE